MFADLERRLARLGVAAAAMSVAMALTLTGCSGSTNGGPTNGGQSGAVFTIAASSPPNSLDPMLESVGPIGNMYHYLVYDSLTRVDQNGKLAPGLATEWKYTDAAHTTLELTLRQGVKFSDGSDLTSEDVVATLNYARKKGVNGPNWMATIDSVTAQGEYTVVIKSKRPDNALPLTLSQRALLGSVLSAEAANDPAKLKTATYGAGPYMLDPNQSVTNSTYVYIPNPHYWDPSHIKWSKVVINVVADYNASLQAVQSGAADLMSGNQPTATAAKAAGLEVATAPFGLTGIQISDRDGTIVPALKDVRVRQALMYAIDRKAIANAVFGGFSTPSASMIVEGALGAYDDADVNAYPYDMEKAKQLLADAGYADGFTFDMSVPTANNTNLMAQAVIQSWAQLKVKANLQTYTDLGQLTTDILAKKYPVSAFNYANPIHIEAASFFSGGATQYNPFNTVDEEIDQALLDAASATTEQGSTDGYAKAWHRSLVGLAWVSNVYTRQQVTIYDSKKITDVFISSLNPILDMWSVRPVS